MSDTVLCPKCSSEFTYPSDNMMVCSQCFYEWDPAEAASEAANEGKILDSNGNELQDGDSVVVVKDLPVKGAPDREVITTLTVKLMVSGRWLLSQNL